MNPETTHIQSYILLHPKYPDRRLVILDTPGFNSTLGDETNILHRVSLWLARCYRGMAQTVAAVIYLHEMTQARLQRTPLRALKLWCDKRGIGNIVLVTARWDEIPTELGEHRERLLKDEWANTIQEGRMCRLLETRDSARSVLELVLQQVTTESGGVERLSSNYPRKKSSVNTDGHRPSLFCCC